MRHKTKETIELISKLLRVGPDQELIKEFGFRECGAIPNFFSMCLNWQDENAWSHLNEWVKTIQVKDLVWLDCAFRLRSYIAGFIDCKLNSQSPFMIRCLMTFHANGKEREKALRDIGQVFTGEELPFILLRLNDWASPVQSIAKKLVRERIKREKYSQYFLRDVYLVDRLKDCWRWSHEKILNEINLYIAKGNPHGILKVIEEGERHASVAAFNLYEKVFPNDLKNLVLSSLKSSHVRLHLKCSSKIEFLEDDCFIENLEFLFSSRPPLRVAAIRSYCNRFPEKKIDFLKGMLEDSSFCVREFSVWSLKQVDESFNAGEFYRQVLKSSLTITGLKALGYYGNSFDIEFLKKVFREQNSIKLKKSALESLVRLGYKSSKKLLFEYLGVNDYSKLTKKLLTPKITSEDSERFYELLVNGNELAKKDTETLIQFLPDVEHGFLLMKLALRFEEYRDQFCKFLGESNFYCTHQRNKSLIIKQYEDNKELFNEKQQRSIDFIFKYWRVKGE